MPDVKLTTFLFCLGFEPRLIGERMIPLPIEIINILTPEYLPTNFTFGMLVGFTGIIIDKDNHFCCEFISPDGSIILKQDTDIPVKKKDPNLDEDMQGIFLNMEYRNVQLKTEGTYVCKLYINDALVGEMPLKVKAVCKNE